VWFCCQKILDRMTIDHGRRRTVKRKLSCAGGWAGKSLSILIRSRLGDSLTVRVMLVNSRIDSSPGRLDCNRIILKIFFE